MEELPLFPLGTLLFPGETLNLHIFEERYRLMIRRCLDEQLPFGVVLIREGEEVIENRSDPRPAQPYLIGTMARIDTSVQLEDGRFLLTAVGTQRFRIREIISGVPYLVARVTPLKEEITPAVTRAAERLRTIYLRYREALAVAVGGEEAEAAPEGDLEIGYRLASRLQVTNERKQRWLEIDAETRMRDLATLLNAELALMPRGGEAGPPSGGDRSSYN